MTFKRARDERAGIFMAARGVPRSFIKEWKQR